MEAVLKTRRGKIVCESEIQIQINVTRQNRKYVKLKIFDVPVNHRMEMKKDIYMLQWVNFLFFIPRMRLVCL